MRASAFSIEFLSFLNHVKMFHWATVSYARHKASDALHQALSTLMDQFVEVYMGKHGHRVLRSRASKSLTLRVIDEKGMAEYVRAFRGYLVQLPLQSKVDAELANLRDEMVTELNQFLYLFELH